MKKLLIITALLFSVQSYGGLGKPGKETEILKCKSENMRCREKCVDDQVYCEAKKVNIQLFQRIQILCRNIRNTCLDLCILHNEDCLYNVNTSDQTE